MIDTEQEVQAWLRLMTSVDKSNQILGLKMLAQIDITDKSSEYKHVNKLLTLFIIEMLINDQVVYDFNKYNYSYTKDIGMFNVSLYNGKGDYGDYDCGDYDYVNLVYEISFSVYNKENFSHVTYMITNDEKYDDSCMYYHKELKHLCYYDEECELGSNEYNMFSKYNLFFIVKEYQCEIKYFEDRFYIELFKSIELL